MTTNTESRETMIGRYAQLRDSHAKGTPEYTAYALIVRTLVDDNMYALRILIARRQEDRARHERLGHHGAVWYYTREIELLQAGLAEIDVENS